MKVKMIKSGLTAAMLLASMSASATPFASNRCNGLKSKIKHPDGAQGVLFDEECQTADVLPPEEGNARMTALAPTANVNFCKSVNKLPTLSENMVTALEVVSGKILTMLKDFEPQEKALQTLRADVDNLSADNDALNERFNILESEESDLKQKYLAAKNAYDDCVEIKSVDECIEYGSALEIAQTEWRGLKLGEYRVVQQEKIAMNAELDKLQRQLARKTTELAASLDPLYALQEKVLGLKTQIADLYKEYAPMRALTGQVVYSVQWSKILNEYQRLNASTGLNFVKVPVIAAKVHATAFVDGGKGQVGIPTLLDGSIPGIGHLGVSQIGEGDTTVSPDSAVPAPVASFALGIGDAAVSGQMTLSAVGACPYFENGLATERAEISADELTAFITVNATYEFPLKARRKYSAQYKLSRMMERIEKKQKKGGFFSSRTLHEVVENSNSSDWFKIKFDANDPEFTYSSKEQDAITKEVKMGLIQRSLGHVAATTFLNGGQAPALPGMMPTGAAVVGDGLIKTCGFWIYCRVGGFILKGLNSIFGSSEAVSKFKRENNTWVSDEVDQVAVLRRTTSLTFTAR